MADYEVVKSGSTEAVPGDLPVTPALIAYALFGVGAVVSLLAASTVSVPAPLFSVLGIVAVIICYVKRDNARGTWLESHMRWLIRTFWYSLLWGVIGGIVFVLLFIVFLLGVLLAHIIWGIASIWVLYRVIRGYMLFKDSRPIPGM